jgi:hypothetical protein
MEEIPQEPTPEPLKSTVTRRLMKEKRWTPEVVAERDQLLSHARKTLDMGKLAGQDWAYQRLHEKYPPLEPGQVAAPMSNKSPGKVVDHPSDEPADGNDDKQPETAQKPAKKAAGSGEVGGGGGRRAKPPNRGVPTEGSDSLVVGLNRIPTSWPALPPNSSLASEIQWVQSCRIDVVEELPTGGVIIRLERAERPAPSKAALGWLETSVRAYAKYCDIAAKAAAAYEDEQEVVRRERMSIDRVRALLSEMTG